MYKPRKPFITPLTLLIPTYETIQGVPKKIFPEINDGILFYGSFATYGGTETMNNDLLVVIDTVNIETFYFPEIKSDCRIVRMSDKAIYDIIGEPENIEEMNIFSKFKASRVKGGA